MAWEVLLETSGGVVVGAFTEPRNFKYTRQENSFCELEFETYDVYDLNLVQASPHNRRIKAYRDGVLKFRGPLQTPLVINQDGAKIIARDYFATKAAQPDDDGAAEYTATIYNITIDIFERMGIDAFIEVDTNDPGAAITRKIKAGQRIDEFLKLSASTNPTSGLWFRIDPQEGSVPNKITWYSYSERVPNAQARFEYGKTTLDNCQGFEIQSRRIINKVTVRGKGVSATVEDTDSQAEYGIHKLRLRRPGVDTASMATAVASKHLSPTPYTIGHFEPGPNAPKLFDDYDVGDKCQAYFKVGKLAYLANDLIPTRVEVTVENGVENVAWGDDIVANKTRRKAKRVTAASSRRYTKGRP